VAGNHFKSKGCGGATGANLDQGDGQSCFNALRVQQATTLTTVLDGLAVLGGEGDPAQEPSGEADEAAGAEGGFSR
jgi:hypothetical protein